MADLQIAHNDTDQVQQQIGIQNRIISINTRLCNTFQKHSADLKLSTNTYLMSVAAVFQKL